MKTLTVEVEDKEKKSKKALSVVNSEIWRVLKY